MHYGVLSECVSIDYHVFLNTWHGRLGHSSYATIKNSFQSCDPIIPFSNNANVVGKVCFSYQLAKSNKLLLLHLI